MVQHLVLVMLSFFTRLRRAAEARRLATLSWADVWFVAAMPAIAGGAGADTVTHDAILKDVYEGGIRELIPNNFPGLQLFEERDAKDWGGRTVTHPAHVGRNTGVGAYAERGALPTAGRQTNVEVRIPMRFLGGRIELSTQVIKASQGPKQAFESAMDYEIRSLVRDLKADMARMIWSDGRGVLAFVNGDPGTTTTVTVDAPGGVAGATNGSRFISTGMMVTFVAPATGAIVASADETVATVPAAGTTFTTNTAAAGAIADNDYVVRANKAALTDVADTNYAKEPMGLLGLVDDGTYVATLHGVNRTTWPAFQSSVIGSVGALSADVIQRGIDLADQRGDGNIDRLGMHHSVRRAYASLMDDGRRYTGGDLSRPDAGTVAARKKPLTFGGIEMLVDKTAPYGMMFGLDTSTFYRYTEVAGEWMDEDGSILQRMGSGTSLIDAFEAFYRRWENWDCERPNANFRLDGITATVAVVHVD